MTTGLQLTSTSFDAGAPIPARHTCDGDDIPPELHLAGSVAGTRSLALVLDDPDAPDPMAPQRVWVHWVVYNLPATTNVIAEGGSRALPPGALEGKNDWHEIGYRGPCPPIGRHRYFFTLYALDAPLPDLHSPDKAALLDAMTGHVLAQAQLMGTYQKSGGAGGRRSKHR